jgi:hypothetical protein
MDHKSVENCARTTAYRKKTMKIKAISESKSRAWRLLLAQMNHGNAISSCDAVFVNDMRLRETLFVNCTRAAAFCTIQHSSSTCMQHDMQQEKAYRRTGVNLPKKLTAKKMRVMKVQKSEPCHVCSVVMATRTASGSELLLVATKRHVS